VHDGREAAKGIVGLLSAVDARPSLHRPQLEIVGR
jgi:hypothetical protein